MSNAEAIFLGILQGITEFLPISSSAHLYIIPYFTHQTYQGLKFDVMLHLASSLAIILYFWRDWLKFVKEGFACPKNEGKFLWLIAAATVPAGICGIFFERTAEHLFRNPFWIATNLMIFAFLLLAADLKYSGEKKTLSLTLKDALIIGLFQCLALMPGVSRSGITITAALFLGYNREDSAKISFYLALPVIMGAGLLEGLKLTAADFNLALLFGFVFSLISAILTINFLLSYLQKRNLKIFVYYRILLGIAILTAL